ncbi:MAG: type II toxin-antitoxin system YoeB family toxin [Saprospiraceae bacterium]|nr:type II toxin-antitoxin system YoeB family toxin [Saprospiraceae bacterium]
MKLLKLLLQGKFKTFRRNLSGFWRRRIDDKIKKRIVYKV